MEQLGSEVRRAIAEVGPAPGMATLVRAWPAAVGDTVARHAWPGRIARDGTLRVSTSSAAWALELTLLEETVLERLRDALGETAPRRIRFAPGPIPDLRAAGESRPRATAPPLPADVRRAAELTAEMEDGELRRLVARAAAASLARGRSDRAV